MTTDWTVVMLVEVQVRGVRELTSGQAVEAALAASSHNECRPERSSVLAVNGGEAEVVKQTISYMQRGKR